MSYHETKTSQNRKYWLKTCSFPTVVCGNIFSFSYSTKIFIMFQSLFLKETHFRSIYHGMERQFIVKSFWERGRGVNTGWERLFIWKITGCGRVRVSLKFETRKILQILSILWKIAKTEFVTIFFLFHFLYFSVGEEKFLKYFSAGCFVYRRE